MDRAVDRWIDEHKNELIDALSANLKIASLKDTDAAAEGAPFGPMIRRALDTALDCGRSLGFETVDYDGYCGAIDMPAGEEQLGIICHLDVVPEGSGWTYPPYGAEIHDGKLYARGTMDDKGPAYAALFAMKAVKECKIPLKRSVRLILGCDEESGMSCLKHYNRVAKAPTLSFSPDAEYPVVNSEKMIFRTEYKKEFKSGITIKAGTRRNVVPGEAVATVPMALSRIVPIMEAFMEGSEFACSAEAIDENSTRIIMKGLAAHASAPEHGKNAMLAMLAVAQCGEQCALMVPTDILARQHYKNLKPFFDAAGIRSALLLGACSAAEKKTISGELQMGLTQIVIGTHALFSKDVLFKDLTFVVIDEQHRFGVNQREALLKKGTYPDLLVMSATPIPRSLAMTIYGDLEPIILNEKPAGRKPVKTRLVAPAKRDDMKKFILNEVQNGNRCYWVVSRVEIDDEGGSRSVGEVQEELESFNSHWKVGAVHGQMDETERDAILNAFAKGDIQVLVATTVIEVGVNVPEANLMVIDAPERFGLAQLHQLRGRVGRGNQEAWCFLIVPQQSPAHERLTHFASTDDGFKIAEMDMQERGAGNLEGSEQSGAWVFRWFDWIADQGLIQKMLTLAEEILDNKPGFSKETQEKIQNWYAALPQGNSDGVH